MLANLSHIKMDFSPVLQAKGWSQWKYNDSRRIGRK